MSMDENLITLRNLAETAEKQVITAPARVYEMLLDMALASCVTEGDAQARKDKIAKTRTALEATAAYLDGQLKSGYQAIGITLTPEVLSAAKNLRMILRDVLTTLSDEAGEIPTSTLDATAQGLREALQTAVGAFLSALFTLVVEAESARGRRGHNLDSAAVEQIGDISSRINLIAVNASIEAARVGEAGRGFAVIANEIQELSRKSEDAVRNIRNNTV